ncbi:MAG: type II secretion system protein N [Steroidobacteraceae bacterium]
MQRLAIIVLAGAVFAAVLLARLPAAWVLPALGPRLTCARVEGTLWSGECAGARLAGVHLDQLTWQVHPAALLGGRLAADLSARRAGAEASGEVNVSWHGPLRARDVHAQLPLEPGLLPPLPPYITGVLEADVAHAVVARSGAVEQLHGTLIVRRLIDSSGSVTPLGSFRIRFPAGPGEPRGRLRDLGGPLWLRGTLRLTPQPGYVLHARVAARTGASPSLLQALQYLGAPDEQGRRPFALAGTY